MTKRVTQITRYILEWFNPEEQAWKLARECTTLTFAQISRKKCQKADEEQGETFKYRIIKRLKIISTCDEVIEGEE